MNDQSYARFFVQNLLKGLLYLAVLIGAFLLIKKFVHIDYDTWLSPINNRPFLVYLVYTISELLFGIIPPEIFMMWSLHLGSVASYIENILYLSLISYGAGLIGFWVGRFLNDTSFYNFIREKILGKYEKYLRRFGALVIILAAATPLPFSGISMLVGAAGYPIKKYVLYALVRFLRFAAYSFIIWEANTL